MLKILVLLGLLQTLHQVQARDLIFVVNEDGAVPCEDDGYIFIDDLFDLSQITCEMVDDYKLKINGKVTFLKNLDPKTPIKMKVVIEKLNNGRWGPTPFGVERANACKTFFDHEEVWHDFVKDVKRVCPPQKGMVYEFQDKSILIDIDNKIAAAPGLEGHYKMTLILEHPSDKLCLVVEGDIVRKAGSKSLLP